MAYKENGEWVATDDNWENALIDDNTIQESWIGEKGASPKPEPQGNVFVFGWFSQKSGKEEGYHFLGVFVLDNEKSSPEKRFYNKVNE